MLGKHKQAILQFSGGKDSTALLYLARPFLDKIIVCYVDTGATFPHVKKFVEETCQKLGANLLIVKPQEDIEKYQERMGLPSDILPIEATAYMAKMMQEKPKVLLQAYTQCCSEMIWKPAMQLVVKTGITLVLRGSKANDPRVGVPSGTIENGVEYVSPLWDWTDESVLLYLKENGVDLPLHYEYVNDSLDCWTCTAHLAHGGLGKMKFMKEHYPEEWKVLAARLRIVDETIQGSRNAISDIFSLAREEAS